MYSQQLICTSPYGVFMQWSACKENVRVGYIWYLHSSPDCIIVVNLFWCPYVEPSLFQHCGWMSYADEYFLILCINCTLAMSIAFRCHLCGKHRHWDSGCLREFCVCVCVCVCVRVRACMFFLFFFNKEEWVHIMFGGMTAFFYIIFLLCS